MSLNEQVLKNFIKAMPFQLRNGRKGMDCLYKGQSGRIGIVGGSEDYTGAPYFAAISSLRVGADIAHVFTTKEASIPIKSYSPELIVQPILDSECSKLNKEMVSRIHCLVVGPGLGRNEIAHQAVKNAAESAKSNRIPIVVDADGLFVLNSDISLVIGYEKCILTPNEMEFKRLYDATFGSDSAYEMHKDHDTQLEAVVKLAKQLNNLTIMKKGSVDIISDGNQTITNNTMGSLKRCGGIGDILSGITGTYSCWCDQASKTDENFFQGDEITNPMIIAAYAASIATRCSSFRACDNNNRSLIASDIIKEIAEECHRKFDLQFF